MAPWPSAPTRSSSGEASVHQLREVRARERALLLRQRLQRQLGLSQQPLAVAARDRAVLLGALGVFAAHRATGASRADLVLRLEVDAARGVRAVIDANVQVRLRRTGAVPSDHRNQRFSSSARG